jgi:lipid-binding SYLF domain-containing protein
MTSKTTSTEPNAPLPVSNSRRHLLKSLFSFAFAPAVVATMNSSLAEAASGRIELRLVRAGFILGFGSGSGSLYYGGKRYRLNLGGVSLGATIGVASVDFVGRARNLRRPSDIEGTYRAVGAGVAAAGGGSVARLRNSRGVELEVRGKQIGFMASVDLSGLRIRIAR